MDKQLIALRRVLAAERAALVAADFAALEALGAKKETILTRLDTDNLAQEDARDMVALMKQVHDMTAAALDGFQSALAGIERNAQARRRLESYGPDGVAKRIETPINDLSRRA